MSTETSTTLLVAGSWDDSTSDYLEIFDSKKNSWKKSKNFELNRRNSAIAMGDHWILVIAGHVHGHECPEVDYIDLNTGEKQSLTHLNLARYNATAVTLKCDKFYEVYVIGGTARYSTILSSVEKWNSVTKLWNGTAVASLPEGLHALSAAVLDGKIYVTGGFSKLNKTVKTLQMYTPSTNTWTSKAQMNVARHAHSSAGIKGKLYVAGGCIDYADVKSYCSSVEFYDPKSNTWSYFTELPCPRAAPSLVLFKDKFVCIGGQSVAGILNDVLEFDDKEKKWKQLSPLCSPREGTIAFVVSSEYLKAFH